jgi:DNA polymerase-3 subunit gamma/tau
MSAYLAKEAAGEGILIDAEALSIVCRSSGGSMRDALSIMDQLVSFSGGEITRESAEGLLRVVEVELLDALSRSILSGRAAEALDAVDEAFARGYSVEELCDAFIEHLRNLMLCASGGTSGLSDLSDREVSLLEATASLVDDTAILNVLRVVSGAASEVRTSSLPRVVLESAVLASARMCSAVGVADLPAAAVERVPRAAPVRREPSRSAPAAPAARPGPVRTPAAGSRAGEVPPKLTPVAGKPAQARAVEQDEIRTPQDPPAAVSTEGTDDGEAESEKKATIAVLDLFDAVSTENPLDRRSN